jgi:hypothetical protein
LYNQNYKEFDSAENLPEEWDEKIGDNIYMRRDFLAFLEKTAPHSQKYYIFYGSGGKPDTIFLTYKNKNLNLGMLTNRIIIVDMTLVYIPIWVKRTGIVFGPERKNDALKFIRRMKGFKIILHCPDNDGMHDCPPINFNPYI